MCATRARPRAGTLPGAREIPLAGAHDSLDGLDPAAAVVVYCASGYRSPRRRQRAALRPGSPMSPTFSAGTRPGRAPGCPSPPAARRAPADVPEVGAARRQDAGRRRGAAPRRSRARRVAGAVTRPTPCCCRWVRFGPATTSCRATGEIVVVCRSGGRSAAVTESLRAWGSTPSTSPVGCAPGRPPACRSCTPTPTPSGLVVHRDPPAQLRDVAPRADRWCGDAQRPLLRSQPLRHPVARPGDVAARCRRSRRAAAAAEPARPAERCRRDSRGRHARVRRQRPLDVRSAGRRRTVAARRGEHRRVDRRAAGRGPRPGRAPPATPWRSCSAAPTAATSRARRTRSGSSAACRSTTHDIGEVLSPTR